MSDINVEFEKNVADFYQSLGVTSGPGDIQYRLIILTLAKNGRKRVTEFSEIRNYTDHVADRGSIGSKMKTVIQFQGLAQRVKHGGYVITDKGLIAAKYLRATSAFYLNTKKTVEMLERLP